MVLQGCKCIIEFPDGMEELVSLEHLNLKSTGITGLYGGIFCQLGNLEIFLCSDKLIVPPKELMRLRHLKTFMWEHSAATIACWIHQCFDQWTNYVVGSDPWKGYDRAILVNGYTSGVGTECCFLVPRSAKFLQFKECSFGVRSLLDALPSLCDATDLKFFKLNSCEGFEYIFPDEWSKPVEVIQELELRRLDDFCGLIREEVVRPNISFGGLTKLEISFCHKLKRLWLLNLELPNLEKIRIEDCDQMEEIFATKEGATIELPKLHSLKLEDLPELGSILGDNVSPLPHLLELVVTGCPKVRKLGLTSHKMPSLAEIEVSYCREMEEIFAAEDEAGDVAAIQFPNLKHVRLHLLPELRNICRNTLVCNSLQILLVEGGDKLVNFPISVSRQSVVGESYLPPVLRAWDKPRDWWDSLHWNDPATKALFQQLRCLTVDCP